MNTLLRWITYIIIFCTLFYMLTMIVGLLLLFVNEYIYHLPTKGPFSKGIIQGFSFMFLVISFGLTPVIYRRILPWVTREKLNILRAFVENNYETFTKRLILAYCGIIILLLTFVPMRFTFWKNHELSQYAFVFSPPTEIYKTKVASFQIEYSTLIIEILITTVIFLGIYYYSKPTKKYD